MNTLYVRVANKGTQQFYRCGLLFTLLWAQVIVDDATAARLREEQMLEVSDDIPDDYHAGTQEPVNNAEVDLIKGAAEKAAAEAAEKAAAEAAEKVAAEAAEKVAAEAAEKAAEAAEKAAEAAKAPAAKTGKAKVAK